VCWIAETGQTLSHHPQYIHLLVHSEYCDRSLASVLPTPTTTLIAYAGHVVLHSLHAIQRGYPSTCMPNECSPLSHEDAGSSTSSTVRDACQYAIDHTADRYSTWCYRLCIPMPSMYRYVVGSIPTSLINTLIVVCPYTNRGWVVTQPLCVSIQTLVI